MPLYNAASDIAANAAPPAPRSPARQDRTSPSDSFASLVDSNSAADRASSPPPAPDARRPSAADDRGSPVRRSDTTDQSRTQDRGDAPRRAANDSSNPPPRTDAPANTTKPAKDGKTAKSGDTKNADDSKSANSKDAAEVATPDQAQTADPTTNAATPTDLPVAVQAMPVPTVDPTTVATTAGAADGTGTATATAGGPLTIAAAAALKAQTAVADLAATGQPAATSTETTAATAAVTTGLTQTDPKAAALVAEQNVGKTDKDADPAATIKTPTTPETPAKADAPLGQHSDAAKPQSGQAKPADAAAVAVDPAAAQPKPGAHQRHGEATAQTSTDPGVPQLQVPTAAPAHTTTLTQQTAAAPQLTAALATNVPVAVQDLAVTIAARANAGASSFEIRLDPAELGRIDVRIEVDRHGQVTSHLTVEKPETLAMLRQDQTQLQRALDNAGLKTGDSGLQFSLRDQSSSGQQQGQQQDNGRHAQRLVIRDEELPPAVTAGRGYGRMLSASGGVDIRI